MEQLHTLTLRLKILLQPLFHGLVESLPKLLLALVLAFLFIATSKRAARLASTRLRHREAQPSTHLQVLFENSFRFLYLLCGMFLALSIVVPSLKLFHLFLILCFAGGGLIFAFRAILQSYLAGILILLTRTFEIGDRLTCNTIEGTVEEITLRSTVIRTDGGDRMIVPNEILMTREVGRRFYSEKGKMSVLFYVPVDAHLEAVMRLVKEIFREMGSSIDAARSKILLECLGERSIGLRAMWRTNEVPPSTRATREYFITRLQEELHRYGGHLGLLEEFRITTTEATLEHALREKEQSLREKVSREKTPSSRGRGPPQPPRHEVSPP